MVQQKTTSRNSCKKRKPDRGMQAGVGLIEVLIAILIASFALLGLAGLQITSLRYQKVAQFRSAASQYTADIADRLRANVAGAKAGNYVTATTSMYRANPGLTGTPPLCPTASSDAAKVATKDICEWRLALAQRTAGGWGEISGDTTAGFVITVYFKEPENKSAALDAKCRAAALDASTDKDVRCFQTTFLP